LNAKETLGCDQYGIAKLSLFVCLFVCLFAFLLFNGMSSICGISAVLRTVEIQQIKHIFNDLKLMTLPFTLACFFPEKSMELKQLRWR